ncbi:MAG: hypothetical protein OEY48_04385 [Gammaproteobacteria bacterium]|nr:hypothetical protein [Gammaproteobacteria bacterium]MDH5592066.1 hypothetical protein [Gammaproteobacteria bacterium]
MMKSLFLIVSLFGLTSCYEDTSVTLHQAGVYKGKIDSHSQTAEQREAILAKRFNLVQTDR